MLSVQQLHDRLDDVTLTRRTADSADRHRSLDASIEWSYDLCTPEEQLLWARLSIFADGWEIDAAEAIGSDDDIAARDVLDSLQALVEKSIVLRTERDGIIRFELLAATREFGERRLRELGDWDGRMRLCTDWYQSLLQRADAEWIGPHQRHWLDRLRREAGTITQLVEHNLGGALGGDDTIAESADRALGLLVTASWSCWYVLGRSAQQLELLNRAIAVASNETAYLAQAHAIRAFLIGRLPNANRDTARNDITRGRALAAAVGDGRAILLASLAEGTLYDTADDPERARHAFDAGLAAERSIDDPNLRAGLLLAVLGATRRAAEPSRTDSYRAELDGLCESSGAVIERCLAAVMLGLAAWRRHDNVSAEAYFTEALEMNERAGDPIDLPVCVDLLACLAAAHHRDPRRATQLADAADGLWRRAGIDRSASSVAHRYQPELPTGVRPRREDHRPAYGRGPNHDPHRVPSIVPSILPSIGRANQAIGRGVKFTLLTTREREIAGLIAQGLSNREIAADLFISVRTAEGHAERIRAKLGVRSRAMIAIWMLQSDEQAS